MTPELFAIALFYAIGWAYVRLILTVTGPAIATAAAFPIGISLWGITAALSVMAPFHYTAVLVTAICVLGLAVTNWWKGASVSALEFRFCAGGLVVLLGAASIFILIDVTAITTDTMFVLSVGKQIAEQGGLTPTMKGVLASFALYLALIETGAVALGLEYFRSFLPLCLISTLLLFILFGCRAIGCPESKTRFWSALIPILGATVLATTYGFLWHGFYIKASPVYTLFLFIVCGCTYFADRERDARWLFIALPVGLATILLRMEAPLTALPMLVVLMAAGNIPRRDRLLFVVPVAAAFAVWYAFLVLKSFAHGLFSVYELTGMGALPSAFAATALILTWIQISRGARWPERVITAMPWVMCAVLALFSVAYTSLRPETALSSLEALYCYLSEPKFGVVIFWSAVIILLLLAPLVTRRVEGAGIFGANALGYILILLAITVITPWKHCGAGDSGNRILTQIMPVVLFYLVLRYGSRLPSYLPRG
jgi:hypothetical protein